ncbi:MAG: asparagine synthetase B, partial [Candidatus Moranbacteria bacterium]|nr:asparagine synthetase B [Candidatus Moranbacteria bacterium]
MCGIVGIINFSDNNDFLEKKNLLKMRDSMTHRGPDDCGNYNDKYVGFGQRRLSILDLSRQGRQPMKYKDKIIIFNGEIYNFQAIKEDLERLGDKFISKTDTEVILHAFEHWGEKCLEKFNGMFAFAIWDRKRRKLFIARDRLGVKPLYYFKPNKNVLVFASEIKAICAYNKYQPEIAKENLFDFFRYSFVPGDKTLFKEIKELLPGHFIKGEATQNNLKLNFKK